MNTVLKRKLTSAIAAESIANNITKGKCKNFYNTTTNHNGNKKKHNNSDKEEPANKRQKKTPDRKTQNKKTHYNENMEPIRLSSTGNKSISGFGSGTVADTACLPKRIREVVWNTYNGETYSSKCYVPWCNNMINVFNYQVGHDIPESKGGTYDIGNLRPICSNCNLSMGNKWTIQEWGKLVNANDKSTCLDNNELISKDNEPRINQIVKLDNSLLDRNEDANPGIRFYTLLVLVVSYMIL